MLWDLVMNRVYIISNSRSVTELQCLCMFSPTVQRHVWLTGDSELAVGVNVRMKVCLFLSQPCTRLGTCPGCSLLLYLWNEVDGWMSWRTTRWTQFVFLSWRKTHELVRSTLKFCSLCSHDQWSQIMSRGRTVFCSHLSIYSYLLDKEQSVFL